MNSWRWTATIGGLVLLVIALTWFTQRGGSRLGFSPPLAANASDEEPDPDATVRALQHITGTSSADELIGKRVEVSATAEQVNLGIAFWTNVGNAPVLVVISRDRRSEVERANGQSGPRGIPSFRPGQKVQLSGSIQQVPAPESRFSWGLYSPQHRRNLDAKVYVLADAVRAE